MAFAYSKEIFRAARLLVGWKQSQLAAAAKISRQTLMRIEDGENVTVDTVNKVIAALEKRGVEFIEATESRGAGIRFIDPLGKVTPHELDNGDSRDR
ncbi:XRE family transcriptional regulator [Rhizobium leguminosarum]|uniref:XRE family transcriptional regulator n=1 Tax=Rhizobium leguminosarum TaxID=384 RepID=A0A4Q8Y9G8_RHILE|nr:helix-turn-helix transcriptional regulator [Rhizobium leguminosarum]TAX72804.1 XRE family transcriptional regulator [Rhizobium leguminosarum]